MPLHNKKENRKVEERALGVRAGDAAAHQKTEQYRKGKTDVLKVKTTFDDGEGTSGKTKTKAATTEAKKIHKRDISAVNVLNEKKSEGNTTTITTNVNSNYACSATFTGTPKEIKKQKKKLKKETEKKKKKMEKEQKKLLKQGQNKQQSGGCCC